jgi:hypothetical protein
MIRQLGQRRVSVVLIEQFASWPRTSRPISRDPLCGSRRIERKAIVKAYSAPAAMIERGLFRVKPGDRSIIRVSSLPKPVKDRRGSLADLMRRLFDVCSSLNSGHLRGPKNTNAPNSSHGTPRRPRHL